MLRRILAAVFSLACLAALSSSEAQIGVTIGGKSGKDKPKSDGCHGMFCVRIDAKTVEKILSPGTPPGTQGNTQVCVTKYADLNGNGTRDSGEPALPGWSFTIRDASGAIVGSGTTNSQGVYCSQSLTPGAATVQETQQSGWTSTDPGGTLPSKPVTLVGGTSVSVSFGNKPSNQICVAKYNDLNGNGVRDSGEPALSGWWFDFYSPSGTVLDFGQTDAQGLFCTSHPLPAGSVTVTETMQSGWVSSDPGGASPLKHVTVAASGTVNVAFGNRAAQGQVCVTKYNDLNGNGIRDNGEPTLPGWTFEVRSTSGTLLDSGATNAQGVFCTSQPIPAGSAVVKETPQSGWANTDPGGTNPSRTVSVPIGAAVNVKFGNHVGIGQICVLKYQDLDNSGIYNSSADPFLAGWQFNIAGPSGPLTLTTGANGKACTPVNLPMGSYTVTEVMQPGWSSTAPGGLSPSRTVSVVNGPAYVPQTFGNVRALPGQICIEKYLEMGANGHRDATDPPLPGWTFGIRNASGVLVATGTTDAQGRYCTAANFNGTYDVREVSQPWWVNTDPQGPPMAPLPAHKPAVVSATRGAELVFGNKKAGQLCIHKYNDLNANGRRDPGEPPLAGWTFRTQYTYWAAANEDQITTDAGGIACVYLPPGPQHQFYETMQPGWVNTDPGPQGGWVSKIYTIVEGQTTDIYVGNRHVNPALGTVCIVKYNDVNHNGTFDASEWKLPGWHFTIKNAQGTVVGTVDTDSAPRACMDLPNGSYTAYETMQMYWHNSDPAGTNPHKTFTIANGNIVTVLFGNYQIAAP